MASSAARTAATKTRDAAAAAAHQTVHAAASTARGTAALVALAPSVAANAALSPSLTGLLLVVLARGPAEARRRLTRALGAEADPERLERAKRVLRVLFALGMARVANAVLNRWALRGWRWGRAKGGPAWDFDGKVGTGEVVVATGGCSGIGKEVVKGLVERGGVGVKVVVVDVVDLPEEFEGRPNIVYYGCDLTSPPSIHETAAMIRADCGDPTVLINNAGIAHGHSILEGSDEYDERLFRVNVLSHFTLIREFLPGMLSQKKGHIVTVASMASYYSCAGLVNYCASKHAVLSLHEGLNVELRNRYGPAGKNIVTSIVHPMWAQTSIISSWEASLRRTRSKILKPTDISDKIVTQVLRGEPAQIYVPKSMSAYASIKAWPHWLQELVRDDGNKRTKPLEEGKGKDRITDVGYGVGGERDTISSARSYDIVEG